MLKISIAMITVGCLVSSSSFATSFPINMFMKNEMVKSSLVSPTNKHINNNNNNNPSHQYKFTGTWEGSCNSDNQNNSVKLQIMEDADSLTFIDSAYPEDTETYTFNVTKSEQVSDKERFEHTTSRLTRINDNTVKFEDTMVDGSQLPTNNQTVLTTGMVVSTLTLNNNQLMMDTNMKVFQANKQSMEQSFSCVMKKVG